MLVFKIMLSRQQQNISRGLWESLIKCWAYFEHHLAFIFAFLFWIFFFFFVFWLFDFSRCWMDINENKGWLAFCLTNMMTLALLVSSGLVMLFLVYRQIRTRDEWKQNRVAFLSIWGLSCLYGTTWGLAFLKFEPISTFILFITCILNSFQGQCFCCTVIPDYTSGLKWDVILKDKYHKDILQTITW